MLQKRDNSHVDSSLSTPAFKRKKTSKLLESSDSSDEELVMHSSKKLHSSDQSVPWKIDRLKTSLQKPVPLSEQKDKQLTAEASVQKPSKDVQKKIPPEEERPPKESKEKVRKEDTKHAREKQDKKPSTVETVSKTPEALAEDRSRKDASGKYLKHSEPSVSKLLEKGNKSDGKQRHTYVIPKLKKTASSTPASSAVLGDTWSDMLRRGAELEKSRPKQMQPNSAGMRRIPKIVPKAGLCGQADVGVLDKIEQHPGFLRWQQATSQKNTSKTENERSSVATKSKDESSPTVQPSAVLEQQTLSTVDSKPLPSLEHSASEISQPATVTASPISALPPTSTKSLLPTPVKSQPTSLLSTPLSTRKTLLPTPGIPQSAAPIPVLVRRGAAPSSRSQFASSPTSDEDHFIPDESTSHPGW